MDKIDKIRKIRLEKRCENHQKKMRKNPEKTVIFIIGVFNLIYDLEFHREKTKEIKEFIAIKFPKYFYEFVDMYSKVEFDRMFFNRFSDH